MAAKTATSILVDAYNVELHAARSLTGFALGSEINPYHPSQILPNKSHDKRRIRFGFLGASTETQVISVTVSTTATIYRCDSSQASAKGVKATIPLAGVSSRSPHLGASDVSTIVEVHTLTGNHRQASPSTASLSDLLHTSKGRISIPGSTLEKAQTSFTTFRGVRAEDKLQSTKKSASGTTTYVSSATATVNRGLSAEPGSMAGTAKLGSSISNISAKPSIHIFAGGRPRIQTGSQPSTQMSSVIESHEVLTKSSLTAHSFVATRLSLAHGTPGHGLSDSARSISNTGVGETTKSVAKVSFSQPRYSSSAYIGLSSVARAGSKTVALVNVITRSRTTLLSQNNGVSASNTGEQDFRTHVVLVPETLTETVVEPHVASAYPSGTSLSAASLRVSGNPRMNFGIHSSLTTKTTPEQTAFVTPLATVCGSPAVGNAPIEVLVQGSSISAKISTVGHHKNDAIVKIFAQATITHGEAICGIPTSAIETRYGSLQSDSGATPITIGVTSTQSGLGGKFLPIHTTHIAILPLNKLHLALGLEASVQVNTGRDVSRRQIQTRVGDIVSNEAYGKPSSAASNGIRNLGGVVAKRYRLSECPFSKKNPESAVTTLLTVVKRDLASSASPESTPSTIQDPEFKEVDDSISVDDAAPPSSAPSSTETSNIHYNPDLAATPEYPVGAKAGKSDAVPPSHTETSLKFFAIGTAVTVAMLLVTFIIKMKLQGYRRGKAEKRMRQLEERARRGKGRALA